MFKKGLIENWHEDGGISKVESKITSGTWIGAKVDNNFQRLSVLEFVRFCLKVWFQEIWFKASESFHWEVDPLTLGPLET